jgi:hypothetical protein
LGPEAEFCAGEPARINITGSTCQGARYEWNFGDGSTSDEINPSHVYARPGHYTIRGRVINSCGEASVSLRIRVNACATPARVLQLVALDAETQRPIAGAQLRWPGGSGRTDAAGIYQLTYRPDSYQSMSVSVTAPGYDSLRQEIYLRSSEQQKVQQQAPQEQTERLYLRPSPREISEVFNDIEVLTGDRIRSGFWQI